MYDELETNLCKEIMQFSGFPFPETAPTFPNRTHVEDYLQAYFHTFIEPNSRVDVRLGCNVERLEKINGSCIYTPSTRYRLSTTSWLPTDILMSLTSLGISQG